jgi:wyosine [tRNA(Phe)-imidazoG37] synthetase (radical SAM superfamily)
MDKAQSSTSTPGSGAAGPATGAIRDHRRQWRDCLYVYPVISRRARALSIGININPDKRCSFDCLYCQVDRHIRRNLDKVDLDRLKAELEFTMGEAAGGRIWAESRFAQVPASMRRINDIAFSGDGEPTARPEFDAAVRVAADAKAAAGLADVKIVVITNSTCLLSPQVARALPILDANNGEIWAKLDAGTQELFDAVNRPHPARRLDDIVSGITAIAAGRAVVIQTLLFRIDGRVPGEAEIAAYAARLREILAGSGRIKLVQLYTIARGPMSPSASTLPDDELDKLAEAIRQAVPEVTVEAYYGTDAKPQRL